MGKYKGSIAEVQDANGRRVVKSRTTTTPPAHNANIDVYIIPVGATGDWSTHIGEVTLDDGTVWLYEASPPNGLRVWVEDEALECVCTDGMFREEIASSFSYDADQLLVPNNSDWAVNAAAGGGVDSNNAALPVCLYDKTVEEGRGFIERSAVGSSKLRITAEIRAEVAPPAVRTAGLKLYAREDGGAWSSVVLNDASLPASVETWQKFVQVITLSSISVGDDKKIEFELCRIAPSAGTNLDTDLALTHLRGDFL